PPRHKLRGVAWADDKRPFYFISTTIDAADTLPSSVPVMFRRGRMEYWRTSVFSLDTKAVTVLMDTKDYRRNSGLTNLVVPIEGETGFVRMVAYGGLSEINSEPRLAVFKVNLDDGGAKPLIAGSALTRRSEEHTSE